ncbi:MAG: orotidine-5'-phosphate decarboxylase [Oscillospiraceae bacterium]
MRDVIIALDFPTKDAALGFLDNFGDDRPYVKIGMELFYSCGPDIVREIKARGHRIFLDLKLHDIPNTVLRAARTLASLGVDMINVHAAGTVEMMRSAREGFTRDDGTQPLVIAVTQLTSTDERAMHDELLVSGSMGDVVAHYAKNAKLAGLNGVVCSPLESAEVKLACGDDFVTVTPGVRFADSAADDQTRITTPARARELRSDYIVVGRPITQAGDPVAAYRRCVAEFTKGE